MKNSEKVSYKGNATFFCNCPACRDSGFRYGNNPVLIEDNNPQIYNFFGRELVK